MTSKQFRGALAQLPPYEAKIRRLVLEAHHDMAKALAYAGEPDAMGFYEKRAEEQLYKLDLLLVKGHL